MLGKSQIARLMAFGVVLGMLATLNIRLRPNSFLNPVRGSFAFVTAIPAGWLSVWLTRMAGKLSADQLLPGIAVAGATAMMIDGIALKWFPGVYGFNDKVMILGAAWLLWGYGVALAVAVIWAARLRRTIA